MYNEVWSYGKQAEPILEKYLRLRYELMPYIYSLGYKTWQTGAPFMRALPLDFPNDPNVADMRDEYMFGPAFLVAPVTDQGATSRDVYLPAGTDWYNYWTNERVKGGQTITAQRPSIPSRCLYGRGRSCRWGCRSKAPMSAGDCQSKCLSGRRCGFHAFFRRWHDLCLRERRGVGDEPALG